MKKLSLTIICCVVFILSILAQSNINIIGNFYQGSVKVSTEFQTCSGDNNLGNCVTIALIKTALVEFGSIENIFKEYSIENGLISCTFQDDTKVSITVDDIALVKEISGIKKLNDSENYNDGIIIYALICQRTLQLKDKLIDRPQCLKNFRNAVEAINSGYATDSSYKLLGFKKFKSISKKEIKNYKSVIIRTGAHAAYCSYGYQDIFGKKYRIRRGKMKNPRGPKRSIKKAYVLEK